MPVTAHPCGLFRRLAAILYDSFLVLAVIIFATLPVILLRGDATEGEVWFTLYILFAGYLYFAFFWTRAGQTLGMRAWRILLVDENGNRPGWRASVIRYLTSIVSWALLGGGFLWILIDHRKRALHDIVSRTRLVVLPADSGAGKPRDDKENGGAG